MENRVPTKPGRIKLTDDSGNVKYYYMERADEPTVEGTPLNKATIFNGLNSDRYGCELPSEAFDLAVKNWGVYTVSLAGWSSTASDGFFTNRVNVAGMLSVYEPFIGLAPTAAEDISDAEEAFGSVKEIEVFDGYVLCKALKIPKTDFTIKITGV